MPTIVVLGLILLTALIVPAVLILWIRGLSRSAAAEMRERLGEHRILLMEPGANFFGRKSLGVAQIRGNGCLALTRDELHFIMWVPRREIRIPRSDILRAEKTRTHVGKASIFPLLRVRFRNEEGKEDAIAWRVRKLPEWLEKLG
ncbi:MAG: hypothetical protein ACYTAF_10520 [Planctomycetota bacterium]